MVGSRGSACVHLADGAEGDAVLLGAASPGAPVMDVVLAGFPFGTWDLPTLQVTGHVLFDYFFSVTVMFAVLALVIAWLMNVVSKS